MSNELAREIADRIAKDVAELSDRTSPDDWPEAMLVTADELILICERNIGDMIAEATGVAEVLAGNGPANKTSATEVRARLAAQGHVK